MSYMYGGPWMNYGAQQPYLPFGQQQATKVQLDEYKRLKRRNNALIIILVIMVILLIAAIIAVFTLAFLPQSTTAVTTETTTTAPVVASININLEEVINLGVNYGTQYANANDAAFKLLSSTTCGTLTTAATAATESITACSTFSMSVPTGGIGISMNMTVTALNKARTDQATLTAVGAALVAGVSPLVITAAKITQVT